MEITDILNITIGILASIGGGGVLVAILSKYFGDIWAKKYLENYKNELREHFEVEKRRIELEFEKSKTKYLRYSNKQFELYNSLWLQLVDLNNVADNLWSEASENNLKKFANTLKETKLAVQKSILFLESYHYERLIALLKDFAEYEIDKKKLIDLRLNKNITDEVKRKIAEQNFIIQNHERMEQYNEVILEIADSFKEQMKSPAT